MQNKIELVANHCNKLALQLSRRECAENQMNFDNDIMTPIRFSVNNHLNEQYDVQNFQPSQVELSALAPSDLALQMVDLALKISDLLQTRFNLTQIFEAQKGKISDIQEEQILKQSSICEESEVGKQNEQRWQNQIQNCPQTLQKNDSRNSSQVEKIKKDFESYKNNLEQKLVAQMNKIKKKRRKISLNEFRIIAKKVYVDKDFRPTQRWCLNFLNRNGFKEFVAIL